MYQSHLKVKTHKSASLRHTLVDIWSEAGSMKGAAAEKLVSADYHNDGSCG